MNRRESTHIRDPIHGSIEITRQELKLVDSRAFQRLRNIKQLGFADLAFPGGTHSRYSHSLGAMHVATRIFDQLFPIGDLPESTRVQYRQTVRLAMLFHDLGHAPFSHATEMAMPELNGRKRTHEDYTLKIILDSELTSEINTHFLDTGVVPQNIAALIDDQIGTLPFFSHSGADYRTILRQIITSECDADRMDYLQRDSVFCGVNYGKFDADWLINNLCPVSQNGQVCLGIKTRAVFSFEDFLLSRYHMFGSVYLHHTAIAYEKMLENYLESAPTEFVLPTDIEQYIRIDDISMWTTLKASQNPWAKRICSRKPYLLLDERLEHSAEQQHEEYDHTALTEHLNANQIDAVHITSKKALSKYAASAPIPMYVVTNAGKTVRLESYTDLFKRYQSPAKLSRIFVLPEQKAHAQKLLAEFANET